MDKKYLWLRKRVRNVIVGCECKGRCNCELSVEDKLRVKRVLGMIEWYLKNR